MIHYINLFCFAHVLKCLLCYNYVFTCRDRNTVRIGVTPCGATLFKVISSVALALISQCVGGSKEKVCNMVVISGI